MYLFPWDSFQEEEEIIRKQREAAQAKSVEDGILELNADGSFDASAAPVVPAEVTPPSAPPAAASAEATEETKDGEEEEDKTPPRK